MTEIKLAFAEVPLLCLETGYNIAAHASPILTRSTFYLPGSFSFISFRVLFQPVVTCALTRDWYLCLCIDDRVYIALLSPSQLKGS